MKVLVLKNDSQVCPLWTLYGDFEVVGETDSAYKLKSYTFFNGDEWIPKNGAYEKCEIVYDKNTKVKPINEVGD